jgi:hypothetical protein
VNKQEGMFTANYVTSATKGSDFNAPAYVCIFTHAFVTKGYYRSGERMRVSGRPHLPPRRCLSPSQRSELIEPLRHLFDEGR